MKVSLKTQPESIELDLQSAAVVVVDMQNAFAIKGGVFDLAGIDISPAAQMIDAIQGILRGVREKRIKVVYLKMGRQLSVLRRRPSVLTTWNLSNPVWLLRKPIQMIQPGDSYLQLMHLI